MSDLERHFEDVYQATYADLVRFATRRTEPDHAEDVAAEAFAVAWRRVGDLPADLDEARAWLFGIARRLLLARRREAGRALPVRLGDPGRSPDAEGVEAGPEDAVVATVDLTAAWQRLSPAHQEAIGLTVWEGLSGAHAARVLGVTAVAYRIRLSRARRTLRRLLDDPPSPPRPALVTEGAHRER